MAEHRASTRLRKQKEKAQKRRESRNVGGEDIGQTADEAVIIRKSYAPSTQSMRDDAIRYFIDFINDPDHGLCSSETGRRVWDDWSEGKSVEELTDYDTAKELNVQLFHAYLLWKVGGMTGHVSRGKAPTIESCEKLIDDLSNAFQQRMTGTPNRKVAASAREYLKTVLVDKYGLKDAKRDRRVPDVDIIRNVIREFWSIKMPNYTNVIRVYVSLIICLLVSSGSRIGSLIRSNTSAYKAEKYNLRGLCWDRIEIWLYRNKVTNTVEIVVEFELIYTKTESGKNLKYKMYGDETPAFDGPSWLLVVGLADGVFLGNPTLAQIYSLDTLRGKDSIKLEVKPEWKSEPVMRHYARDVVRIFDETEGMRSHLTTICHKGIIFPYDPWSRAIHQAQMLAGYPKHFAAHDIRTLAVRSALLNKDTRLTDLQYAIGHNTLGQTWTSYLGNENIVQFKSLIMGDSSASTILAEISKMTRERRQDLPTYLTKEEREALQEDEELEGIRKEQLEMKNALRLEHGTLSRAPHNQRQAYQDFFYAYRSREAVLYRQVLYNKIQASAAEGYTATFANESDISLENQIDTLQPGDEADYDIDLATNARDIDYSDPAQIISLLTGNSDPQAAVDFLRQKFCGEQQSEQLEDNISQTRSIIGPTSSQVRMPPPPVPMAESSSATAVIDPLLLGPEGRAPAPLNANKGKGRAEDSPSPDQPSPATSTVLDRLQMPAKSSRRGTNMIDRLSRDSTDETSETTGRSRAASVTSMLSTTSSVPAQPLAAADTDGSIRKTAQVLASIGRDVMTIGVDRLEFFQNVLELPAKITEAVNWIPGVFYIMKDGEQHCPICDISRGEWKSSLETDYKIPSKFVSLWKKHIFKCLKNQAFEAGIENVVNSFKQNQVCPLCPHRDPTPVEHDDTDDDDDDTDDEPSRSPNYWLEHVQREHSNRPAKLCSCGAHVSGSAQLVLTHYALKHDIYGARTEYLKPISSVDFSARHSLRDGCFHVDPRTYELDREQEYLSMVDTLPPNTSWATRTDISPGREERKFWNQAVGRLNAIARPLANTLPDTRWLSVSMDAHADFYDKDGYCIFCFFDESEPYSVRMKPWNLSTNHRGHVMIHLFNIYRKSHPHLALDPSNQVPRQSTASVTAAHHCPDVACHLSQIPLLPWDLLNHLVIHHRALQINPRTPNDYLSLDDAGFRSVCIKMAKAKKRSSDSMASFGLNWEAWQYKGDANKPKVKSKSRSVRDEPTRQKRVATKKRKTRAAETESEGDEMEELW